MYVSIGPAAVVRRGEIIGVFDLDNATWSHRTRKSLAVCEKQGCVLSVGDDLPRSMVLCSAHTSIRKKRRKRREKAPTALVYMTPLASATIEKRVQSEQI